jgi:glycosyltransferase involved in cell wall biosynthesis
MARILVVQPSLQPPGGGNGVCAWMLQALRDEHELTVLTWTPVDLDRVNDYYGTSLRTSDVTALLPTSPVRAAVNRIPLPLAQLKASVLRRRCKAMMDGFDLIVGAHGEADFGQPGIQYVHYPVRRVAPLPVNLRWFHRLPALKLYERCCSLVSPFDDASMRENMTLVNSAWTGRFVARVHDVAVRVVHPPAAGLFEPVSWARRENGFLCVGRLSPEKRIEQAIEMVRRVRERQPAAHLHIVGEDDHLQYAGVIRDLVRRSGTWVTIEGTRPFPELARLLSEHRYLIHAMPDEHFGMSIAQAIRAGCIAFVPDDGGQVEIVGDEPMLRYGSTDDGVEKILRVMADVDEQQNLASRLRHRAERFGPDRFMQEIRSVVGERLDAGGVNATRRT